VSPTSALLGPAEIRALAASLGVRPAKALGQNFVHDPNTIRRIVRTAQLPPGEPVLEIGPGLGSLTLGLLAAGHPVTAVELDPVLAAALPATVAARLPGAPLTVVHGDALRYPAPEPKAAGGARVVAGPGAATLGAGSTSIVANQPYNVAVPVVLHLLAALPGLRTGLVLVQAEVADRLAAGPGSKVYGAPSVKLAWYAAAVRSGAVPRTVFWPVPNVDSGLVRLARREPPTTSASRTEVFAVVDAAFAQRRKMLRSALAGWAGSPARAEAALQAAGVVPSARGETLSVSQFAAIAEQGRRR
jgi:16S rRNA (adenine1518-N6/adenine1519-N6)-dimethyltransferase